MTVELLQLISLVFLVVAAISFLVCIALFFLLDIPKVIGDVSGKTARKAIEEIRKQNEQTGNKAYKSSNVNLSRGRVTDKISNSGRLHSYNQNSGMNFGTQKISTTDLVMPADETALLQEQPMQFNQYDDNAYGETELLSVDYSAEYSNLSLDVEIGFTNSDYLIE